MEHVETRRFSKVLYGSLFVIVLPIALLLWARAASGSVKLEPLHSLPIGVAFIVGGAMAIAAGMANLWTRGGGLPMNAFPPPRFVRSGVYGLVPHPIYGGFVMCCGGTAILTGSASGLWLVTPIVAMAASALVLGYELPDLKRRFGQQLFSAWLTSAEDRAPTIIERIRVYLVVILPWLVAYECVVALGVPRDAISTYLPFETHLPVVEWTEIVYASTYVVVALAPAFIRNARALRQFSLHALTAIALVFPVFLLAPLVAVPRPFQAATALGELLKWERTVDSASAAFPSFHVVWAFIAASALGFSGGWRRKLWLAWAVLVATSCVTTGMHSVIDVVGGLVAFAVIIRLPKIWLAVLRAAERIANSWHEWRFGPVRIINHGAYAGVAVLVGMTMIDAIVGSRAHLVTVSIFGASTIGAALWAQWVEGSPSLLRPLGFYGGMLGAVVGALAAAAAGVSLWTTFAAICVAAPWIQAIGRLRCCVQGCCHGRATVSVPGMRYSHPRSRVCRLAGLSGVPVHATPVYSILWNVVTGLTLLRLAHLHLRTTLICGVYLLMSGIGRFVEEAYRGEPQTLIAGGLRFYQWAAITTAAVGAVLTSIGDAPLLPARQFSMSSVAIAFACGLAAWFVSGVDFPDSSRRFARLT